VPGDRAKGEAYQRQAESDYRIARCLRTLHNGASPLCDTRCHIAAMCQQAIEKSVKGLYIAFGMTPKRTHQVAGLIIDMVTVATTAIGSQLCQLFSPSAKRAVRELGELVPKSNPNDPDQAARNNEYPFSRGHDWMAPCDDSAFHDAEIARYLQETGRIVKGVTRIRAAIYRERTH
jgi:hypothetical protein